MSKSTVQKDKLSYLIGPFNDDNLSDIKNLFQGRHPNMIFTIKTINGKKFLSATPKNPLTRILLLFFDPYSMDLSNSKNVAETVI